MVVSNSTVMMQGDTDRKLVREAAICKPSQLTVKVACRCFALKRFNVIPIKNREGEYSLWTLYGLREQLCLQKLNVQWPCMLAVTRLYPMMSDTQSVHNTDDNVRGSDALGYGTRATSMTKMECETNVNEGNWFKEMSIPSFNGMKWCVGVGRNDAVLAKLGGCKEMDTMICSFS
jgi:hypothetical protein